MRVVGGEARGRRLIAPPGRATRPTSDSVREAIFNILGSMGSLGSLDGAKVLDLFAGSGALGVEALSRGAAHATFVDSDGAAVAATKANVESLSYVEQSRILRLDAFRFLEDMPAVDVAFVDPPYAFAEWPKVLESLRAGIAVIESGTEIDLGSRWGVLKTKHYGSTVVIVAQPASGATE
jgi:16S rRNA (guanine966-N2)-methyltransferase